MIFAAIILGHLAVFWILVLVGHRVIFGYWPWN